MGEHGAPWKGEYGAPWKGEYGSTSGWVSTEHLEQPHHTRVHVPRGVAQQDIAVWQTSHKRGAVGALGTGILGLRQGGRGAG